MKVVYVVITNGDNGAGCSGVFTNIKKANKLSDELQAENIEYFSSHVERVIINNII